MSARSSGGRTGGGRARTLHNQVMWNRLISVVEEQALALVRTAFSTSVREAGDLSAGVFDTHGRMIAQAVTGTPGHVNTMAAAVPHFINDIGPERIFPGDVYITNDPWKGTGHLHDITVCTPVFRPIGGDDGVDVDTLIGFFASTAHVVDVGGRGYGPDAKEVYEEGINIPIMKWVDRGALNQDLVNIIRVNVREADQVIGDIHGLAASNETGRRRLLDMLDEFTLDDLSDLAAFVFDRTDAATQQAIAKVAPGVYRNEMVVDGYGDPVTLAVAITVTDDGMHADFTGTSPVCPLGINVPLGYAHAYFTYGMLVALGARTAQQLRLAVDVHRQRPRGRDPQCDTPRSGVGAPRPRTLRHRPVSRGDRPGHPEPRAGRGRRAPSGTSRRAHGRPTRPTRGRRSRS